MSMPVTLERTTRVPLRRKAVAKLAVGVARALVPLSPMRLRTALEFLSRGARPATAAGTLSARQAVVASSTRCAGQRCLERSVAVALLCRAGGTWPQWCTGVRVDPFRAHAWVEVDGVAVDEADDMSLYRKTITVLPRHPVSTATTRTPTRRLVRDPDADPDPKNDITPPCT
ncbi:lasso peptide biosynthesis B2 protein [Streptomyces sp. NPDC050433]|uniref:lasso peptide biosynthesis B2 protein n=1 Tax=Streptomyces sp. NPDC050433 TaxID=3365615 RepID=UPI00378B4D77